MIGRGQVQAGMVIGMMIGMGSGAGRHDDRQGSGAEGGRLGLAWLGWAGAVIAPIHACIQELAPWEDTHACTHITFGACISEPTPLEDAHLMSAHGHSPAPPMGVACYTHRMTRAGCKGGGQLQLLID